MKNILKRYCVVLASGTGSRFGASIPKQFVRVHGKMIIEYTLDACSLGGFDEIILVVSSQYVAEMKALVAAGSFCAPILVVAGGNSRIESCGNGVAVIKDEDALVVVHNGVQPFVGMKSFNNCFDALERYSAVTCGVKCAYTILKADEDGVLADAPDRSKMYSDMGPEGFRLRLLRKVVNVGLNDNVSTDLCGVVFRNHLAKVYIAGGETENIKITFPEDILLAEQIFKDRRRRCNGC